MGLDSQTMQIHEHCHGKARVRVARRWVDDTGVNHFMELNAQVLTYSQATAPSFTRGDNSMVVATDTCKNIAYHVMKESQCTSADHFAIAYAQKFVQLYAHIHRVETVVSEALWTRISTDGVPHNHSFSRGSGAEANIASAVVSRSGAVQVESGIRDISLLKTTRSSWIDFHRDEYCTLPDVGERMLSTELTVKWMYSEIPNFHQFSIIRAKVRKALIDLFSGPSVTGHHSNGMQESLYKMGTAVLTGDPNLSELKLHAPNIHFLPAPSLAAVGKFKFEDDVFLPTDEPRGLIELVLRQSSPSKL